MTNGNKIKDTAETVRGIVEAVPVYQDVLQPGKTFGTLVQIQLDIVKMRE